MKRDSADKSHTEYVRAKTGSEKILRSGIKGMGVIINMGRPDRCLYSSLDRSQPLMAE